MHNDQRNINAIEQWDFYKKTHSGGFPRRPNDVKINSTRWRGPARNLYTHCRGSPSGLINVGAWKVPFNGPSGVLTNFWSHSAKKEIEKKEETRENQTRSVARNWKLSDSNGEWQDNKRECREEDILGALAVVRPPGGGGSDGTWSRCGSGASITSRAESGNRRDESRYPASQHPPPPGTHHTVSLQWTIAWQWQPRENEIDVNDTTRHVTLRTR